MATYLETSSDCPECRGRTLARARSVNHLLHFFVSVFMCGWWLWVWAILCIFWSPQWLCTRCGTRVSGPGNVIWRIVGGLMLAAALGVAALFVAVIFFAATRPHRTPSADPLPDPEPAIVRPTEVVRLTAPTRREPRTRADSPAPRSGPDDPPARRPDPPAVKRDDRKDPDEPPAAPRQTYIPPPAPKPAAEKPTVVPTHVLRAKKGAYPVLASSADTLAAYAAALVAGEPTAGMEARGEVIAVSRPLDVVYLNEVRDLTYVRLAEGEHKGKSYVVRTKDVVLVKK